MLVKKWFVASLNENVCRVNLKDLSTSNFVKKKWFKLKIESDLFSNQIKYNYNFMLVYIPSMIQKLRNTKFE